MEREAWSRVRQIVVAGSAGDVPIRPSLAVMCEQAGDLDRRMRELSAQATAERQQRVGNCVAARDKDLGRCLDVVLAAMRAGKSGEWWGSSQIVSTVALQAGTRIDATQSGRIMNRAIAAGKAEARDFRGRKQWRLVQPKAGA